MAKLRLEMDEAKKASDESRRIASKLAFDNMSDERKCGLLANVCVKSLNSLITLNSLDVPKTYPISCSAAMAEQMQLNETNLFNCVQTKLDEAFTVNEVCMFTIRMNIDTNTDAETGVETTIKSIVIDYVPSE